MTTFSVNPLSGKSINDTLIKLQNYKESLQRFPELFAKAIEEKLNEILEGQAPPMGQGLWTSYVSVGEDKSSAIFSFEGNVEFIEFGTGIVGKHNHDGINTDWLSKLPPPYTEYNRGPCIVHFPDENMDYWVYRDEQGMHRTQGIPADPFIYRSVQELMRQHAEIARDVFKKNNIGKDIEIWS